MRNIPRIFNKNIICQSREIWVGDIKIYLWEDGILEITPIGNMDGKIALHISEAVLNLTEENNKEPLILVDLNKAGKQSPESRKIWKAIQEKNNHKVALYGMHQVARVIASFFISFISNNKTGFFTTREEAVIWLKNK